MNALDPLVTQWNDENFGDGSGSLHGFSPELVRIISESVYFLLRRDIEVERERYRHIFVED